jgi:large subunit ribosomal protein L17
MQRVLRSQADFKTTLLRNQLTSLVTYEAITTTAAKAVELEAYANRFFNRVKAGDFLAKRLAHETLLTKISVQKLFEEVLPRFEAETTTFVTKHQIAPRRGDSAKQAMISLQKLLKVEKKAATPAAQKPKAAKAKKEAK